MNHFTQIKEGGAWFDAGGPFEVREAARRHARQMRALGKTAKVVRRGPMQLRGDGRPGAKMHIKIADIIAALQEGHCTEIELRLIGGMASSSTRAWLKAFQKKGLLHIAEWERNAQGCPCIPVYAWGAGRDARKPLKATCAERQAAMRARQLQKKFLQMNQQRGAQQ